MGINTGIRIADFERKHCEKILGAYESAGLEVNRRTMAPEWMAESVREELMDRRKGHIQFRPHLCIDNKLFFDSYLGEDSERYVRVMVSPDRSLDCKDVTDRFNEGIRKEFGGRG